MMEPSFEKLLGILADAGVRFVVVGGIAVTLQGYVRIIEEVELCQIDIFTRMSGRTFADVIRDADYFPLREHRIAYASKMSLIGWKEKSVREKDRLDAMALRKLAVDPKAFD